MLEISQRHSGTSENNGVLGLKSSFNVRAGTFLMEIKGTDANGVEKNLKSRRFMLLNPFPEYKYLASLGYK